MDFNSAGVPAWKYSKSHNTACLELGQYVTILLSFSYLPTCTFATELSETNMEVVYPLTDK